MPSQIENEIKALEKSGRAWDAPLHASGSNEPRTAAIGLFPSGWLALMPDILDPYSPVEDGFSKALVPVYGGIRRDALVKLLRCLATDLGAILDGVEDGAFGEEASELIKDMKAEAGRCGFGENDGASIEHVAYHVGDSAGDLGITSDTTDDDLVRIEAALRADAIAQEIVLVGNVGAFLREVREDAAEDDA